MNEAKNITVAFTGHRSYDGSAEQQLRALLEELYQRGFRRFLSGMSWGFDLAAAEAVIALRREHSDVRLIAVEPYAWFGRLFRGEDLVRYERVKAAADECVTVGERGDVMDYIARNDFLVASSSAVVAWWSGVKRGGTAYTIKQALRAGLELHNLYALQGELFPL